MSVTVKPKPRSSRNAAARSADNALREMRWSAKHAADAGNLEAANRALTAVAAIEDTLDALTREER